MLKLSGDDAFRGNTRSHPEHDGQARDGRKYYAGDGMGGQVVARFFINATSRKDRGINKSSTSSLADRLIYVTRYTATAVNERSRSDLECLYGECHVLRGGCSLKTE